MIRIVRIFLALVLTSFGAATVHSALGLGSDFLELGPTGLVDVVLLVGAVMLASLVDREFFWPPIPKRNDHRRFRAMR